MVSTTVDHPLARADGSGLYTSSLHSVLASVNGPVEVQRRDELAEEATVEVNVRPVSGTSGPRERWLESVIHSVLKNVMLVHLHPRTLYQITLQIVRCTSVNSTRSIYDTTLLPVLLNAAFLALVDASAPLKGALVAFPALVDGHGAVVLDPNEIDLSACRSVHAMAFSQTGEMLLCESVGGFDLETWGNAAEHARAACVNALSSIEPDVAMANDATVGLGPWSRQVLQSKVKDDNAWRQSS